MVEEYSAINAERARQMRREHERTQSEVDALIATLTEEERDVLVMLRRLARAGLISDQFTTRGGWWRGRSMVPRATTTPKMGGRRIHAVDGPRIEFRADGYDGSGVGVRNDSRACSVRN